jgi:hypothetical protein
MHPWMTSLQASAHEACEQTLESAGVLTFAKDSSGSAAPLAPCNAVAERQLGGPFSPLYHTVQEVIHAASTDG